MIGKLFNTGILDNSKKIALTGPMVKDPSIIDSENGANLDDILTDKVIGANNRIISGSVLTG